MRQYESKYSNFIRSNEFDLKPTFTQRRAMFAQIKPRNTFFIHTHYYDKSTKMVLNTACSLLYDQ